MTGGLFHDFELADFASVRVCPCGSRFPNDMRAPGVEKWVRDHHPHIATAHPGDPAYLESMREWDEQFWVRFFGVAPDTERSDRPTGWTVVHALNPDGTRELVVVVKSPLPPAVEAAVAVQERVNRQLAMNARRDVTPRRWLTQYGPYWVTGQVERWRSS